MFCAPQTSTQKSPWVSFYKISRSRRLLKMKATLPATSVSDICCSKHEITSLLINSFYHFTAYLATALYHFYDPLVSLITHLISSNTSGLSFSLSFILSFIAMMIVFALSSAPCFELFSAAPVSNNFKLSNDFQNFVVSIQWLIKFNFYNVDQKKGNW